MPPLPGTALGLPAGATPAGVLQLQLSLHPKPPAAVDEPLLALQQRGEAARDAEVAASFIAAAKAWYADYLRIEPGLLRHRPVKVGWEGHYSHKDDVLTCSGVHRTQSYLYTGWPLQPQGRCHTLLRTL